MKTARNWILIVVVIIALIIIFVPFGRKDEEQATTGTGDSQEALWQGADTDSTAKGTVDKEKLLDYQQADGADNPLEVKMDEVAATVKNMANEEADSQEIDTQVNEKGDAPANEENQPANDENDTQNNQQSSKLEDSATLTSEANSPTEAWVVQVGSFAESKNAMGLINRLKEEQFRVFSKTVLTEQGKVTRVFVGPELQRTLAEQLQIQLNNDGAVQGVVVAYNPMQY